MHKYIYTTEFITSSFMLYMCKYICVYINIYVYKCIYIYI